MSILRATITDLLFNCSWNCTSNTGHIVKVLLAASRGTLEEEIHNDLRTKGDYMRGDYLSKLPILQAADTTILFETVLAEVRTSSLINTHNLEVLLQHNCLDLFREFETNFRGDIQSITLLPLQPEVLLLQTSQFENGKRTHNWWVATKTDEQWKTTSESWVSAEHAMAAAICPDHKYAVIALIRDSKTDKQ
jgi:hypothetical protein